VDTLDPADQRELGRDIERAVAHATTLPDPPHNPVRRAVATIGEKFDRAINDTSTTWHPGVAQLPASEPERPGES
jgi:hypothetical protein